jgi:hypothetical protein
MGKYVMDLDEIAQKYFDHPPLEVPERSPQPIWDTDGSGRVISNFKSFDAMLYEGEDDIAWDILFEIAIQRGATGEFLVDMANFAGESLKDDDRKLLAEVYRRIH